jgi:hypothetical protein
VKILSSCTARTSSTPKVVLPTSTRKSPKQNQQPTGCTSQPSFSLFWSTISGSSASARRFPRRPFAPWSPCASSLASWD